METTEKRDLEFYRAILPWSDDEIRTAIKYLDEAGVPFGNFGDHLAFEHGLADDEGNPTDLCAVVLEYIAIFAGADALAQSVYSDSEDSHYEMSPARAGAILLAVPESTNRGKAWKWLWNTAGADERRHGG